MLYRMDTSSWSVERVMFAFGGLLATVFALLALFVHPAFAWGAGFVGVMCINFALTGWCPGAIIAAKLMKK
jgi:hypothetical protein